MNDDQLREAYARHLRTPDASGRLPSLPPPERVAALVAREGSEAERLRTLDVLLSSAEGRRDLDVAWALARATPPSAAAHRRRPVWYAAAATMVVAIGVGGVWLAERGGDGQVGSIGTRGVTAPSGAPEVTRGEEAPVRLIAPSTDPVASVGVEFIWHRVARAGEYTLVIVDTAGNEVFAEATRDSSVVLPNRVQLVPGYEYLWWVEASLDDGSTVSAVTQRLRVRDQPG